MADTLKENLPTLLSSKNGLKAACGIFNILDAKDRKTVLKAFKPILKEALTNRVAYLFLVHMSNTLDDTVLTKKKLLTEVCKNIDEMISDKTYQNLLVGLLRGFDKKYFTLEERHAHETLQEHTSSKKGEDKIREENV